MSVNYIVEINALDDWELTHPLSATAYKVLRKLLYLANKERFPERISVSNTVLMSLAGCSEDSLIKARNQLIQARLIDYKGQKKITPLYTIHYFSHNPAYNPKLQSYEQGIKQGYEQGIKQGIEPGYEQGTYINKTIDNNNDKADGHARESAAGYMARCGIPIQANQYEALRDFYEQGMTDEMMCHAADIAVEHNAVNFAFVRKVIDNWIVDGIRSVEEAKARSRNYRQERPQTPKPVMPPPPAGPAPRFFRTEDE